MESALQSGRILQNHRRAGTCISWSLVAAVALGTTLVLTSCSMSEEVKRIARMNQLEHKRETAAFSDLTGRQIFLRSCNTCHPGGAKGMGPALDKLAEHFPADQGLKSFIRKGKGIMPAQPKEALNDREMENLVEYLRSLNQ